VTYRTEAMRDVQSLTRVAQALADETRVSILTLLLAGDATVSDLAVRAGLPQPRISTHLAVLRDAGLVTVQTDGRQRTYHVDVDRIGALFTALHALTPPGRPRRSAQATRQVNQDSAIRRARTCYDHLAGVAGVELLEELLRRGWLTPREGERPTYALTPSGEGALAARGVDLDTARRARRTFAFGCLDWTERRPHLGGALGAQVLRALEQGRTVRRESGARAVRLGAPIATWLGS